MSSTEYDLHCERVDRVVRAIAVSGKTLADFAAEMGISPTTLKAWMRPKNGRAARNCPESMARLAEYVAGLRRGKAKRLQRLIALNSRLLKG